MTKIAKDVDRLKYKKRPIPVKYTIAFFVLIAFISAGFFAYLGFYQNHWYTGAARITANILPLPVAKVEGDLIWYQEVVELAAVLLVSGNGEDVLSDPFDRALEMAIDRKHVVHLAGDLGTGIDQEDIDSLEISDENLDEFLTKVGWNIDDYRQYIIEPLLLYQAVEDAAYLSREHQKVAFAEMESIKENIDVGVAFIDLAKQYSDDASSILGGDVGYFKEDELDEDLKAIFALEFDEVSEILETDEYFVIAKAYDVIFDGEERHQVGVRIITIDKNDLSVVLEEYKKGKEVKIFVK